MAKKLQQKETFRFRVNDDLKGNYDVRIVGESIESRVVSLSEAKSIADEIGLDLIEINNKVEPPIMRLANYEKMLYEIKKNEKKKNHSSKPLKEVQLSVNISPHDLETKANNARKFIENGSKVKVTLSMRGRELSRREENKRSILEFITLMDEVASPESMPKDEGTKTIVILKPKKKQ
jgi:translation initiation factor IF-3